MKKIILTERQTKVLMNNVINEQQINTACDTSLLSDILNRAVNLTFRKEMAKFKVTEISGPGVKFNGKPVKEGTGGYILVPGTTITMCTSDFILMSGMGISECGISLGNGGLQFIPRVA